MKPSMSAAAASRRSKRARSRPPPRLHRQAEMLHRAVARLPPSLAEVHRLRAAGMPYDEVAEILSIPVGTHQEA